MKERKKHLLHWYTLPKKKKSRRNSRKTLCIYANNTQKQQHKQRVGFKRRSADLKKRESKRSCWVSSVVRQGAPQHSRSHASWNSLQSTRASTNIKTKGEIGSKASKTRPRNEAVLSGELLESLAHFAYVHLSFFLIFLFPFVLFCFVFFLFLQEGPSSQTSSLAAPGAICSINSVVEWSSSCGHSEKGGKKRSVWERRTAMVSKQTYSKHN